MPSPTWTVQCMYCIDGWQPLTVTNVLGPVYLRCLYCDLGGQPCPNCSNCSFFPADFTCKQCLGEHLAELDVAATFCPTCGGITDIIPIDTVPPEVAP